MNQLHRTISSEEQDVKKNVKEMAMKKIIFFILLLHMSASVSGKINQNEDMYQNVNLDIFN